MADTWTLKPGDKIVRKDLHRQYGGSGQGGICPSSRSPNVFVFTDPEVGEQHGYFDRWDSEAIYNYTGEGQRGDQRIKSGNTAILNHKAQGRALRLFRGSGGTVQYEGQFEVDDARPYYTMDAPETGGGPIRSVLVFRLRPIDTAPQTVADNLPPPRTNTVREMPPEAMQSERFFVDPERQPYEAEKREALLIEEFRAFLKDRGDEPCRFFIVPEGEAKPILCDIYLKKAKQLIEAKGTVERGAIRMALGQLLDYSRFVDAESRAVLLPEKPRPDLLALLSSASTAVYYRTGKGKFAFVSPDEGPAATGQSG
jgi:hypothetical protein